MASFPRPEEGVVVTHFIVTPDIDRSRRFYADVLLGGTDDINAVYEQWRARGAEFLTPLAGRGVELRCYMRDPDGRLIEVGQATRIPAQGSPG